MSTLSINETTVNSFYLAFYGRPADPAGLKFWATQLAANDGDLGAITQAFANSEEAQVRFGTDTVADRITEIYQQLFNRAPDATGLAFWTEALAQGHASMADIAVSILGGAQGSDASLSVLRQQAADAFTASVAADGTEYSGYASIEAARILVRAVTADATAADLDALVKAAVSFADTATKNPAVVEAIAVNTTLLGLFDTTRGVKEPVELAQALADTAKAAAGDPVTLESLLRGGGMDKVLKVMPAKATLKDVVDALSKGGLPAAVEVVYPTAPTTPSVPVPTFSLALSFESVEQGKLDKHDDNITNESVADVTFSYEGRDLRAGQHFEYSINGGAWIDSKIAVDIQTNTVVLQDVPLGQLLGRIGTSQVTSDPLLIDLPHTVPATTTTSIALRAVDAGGAATKPFVQDIVYDGYVAQPVVVLKNDNAHGELGSLNDGLTNDGTLQVLNLEKGATVDYLVVPKQVVIIVEEANNGGSSSVPSNGNVPTTSPTPPVENWTTTPEYAQGQNTVWVRVTDVAGNQSMRSFSFTLDTVAPATPIIKLDGVADGGSGNVTVSSGLINISGLDAGVNTAWEYSTDKGLTWLDGGRSDGTTKATLTLTGLGEKSVLVRQYDAAGNVSKPTKALEFTLDAPALEVDAGPLGLQLKSTLAGTFEMALGASAPSIALVTGQPSTDGSVLVTAQEEQVSGVVTLVPVTGSSLTDAKATVYTLGTVDADIINASYAWGFDGNDIMTGTGTHNVLHGGDGNDTLNAGGLSNRLYGGNGIDRLNGSEGNEVFIGGAGGDIIRTNGGHDTVVIEQFTDSYFSLPQGPAMSYDSITTSGYNIITFEMPNKVEHAFVGVMGRSTAQSMEALYAEFTNDYLLASGGVDNAAVLLRGEGGQFLLVDNGDHKIDANDTFISINYVSQSTLEVDGMGNLVYTSGQPV